MVVRFARALPPLFFPLNGARASPATQGAQWAGCSVGNYFLLEKNPAPTHPTARIKPQGRANPSRGKVAAKR